MGREIYFMKDKSKVQREKSWTRAPEIQIQDPEIYSCGPGK